MFLVPWPSPFYKCCEVFRGFRDERWGTIERNRRRKKDRDRWYPSHSPRRTPLFRKRDLTFQESRPWMTEVIGSERNSRLFAVTPPSSLHFGERRRSIRAVRSNLASGVSWCRGWRCRSSAGRNNRFSNTTNTDRRENRFYLTLLLYTCSRSLTLPSSNYIRSNRFATVSSFCSIIVSFSFSTS